MAGNEAVSLYIACSQFSQHNLTVYHSVPLIPAYAMHWAAMGRNKLLVLSCSYSLIAFNKRVFGFNASGHCLVHVRMLHYLHVGSRITITQSHAHTMQQTHTHKTVTGRVEAKTVTLS